MTDIRDRNGTVLETLPRYCDAIARLEMLQREHASQGLTDFPYELGETYAVVIDYVAARHFIRRQNEPWETWYLTA